MGSLDETLSSKHINLQLGWPTPSLFPAQSLVDAAQHVLLDKELSAQALVYGPDPGHKASREATTSWLGRLHSLEADSTPSPDNIFITNGASAGIGYLLARFTDPTYTRRIWMVEPTYFLACPVFEQAGFKGRLRGVPEDDQGIDLAYLKHAMDQAGREDDVAKSFEYKSGRGQLPKTYRHIIYVVPTFSNPSGKRMPRDRRIELIQLAREYNALIISDDVYDSLGWADTYVDDDNPQSVQALPPRLVDVDRQLPGYLPWGNAVSNGSFSKIVGPGVRVGWIDGSLETARDLCKLGPVVSGGCQGHLASMMVSDLLQTGALEKHISDVLVPTYRKRRTAMLRAIDTYLIPLGITVAHLGHTSPLSEPATLAGGFFLYLNLPCSMDTVVQLGRVALEEFNLKAATGSMMVVAGDEGSTKRAASSFGRGIRLCWSWHEEDEIVEGVQRLAAAYKKVTKGRMGSE